MKTISEKETVSKIPEWDLPIKELQSIDFRLKVSIEAPRGEDPEDYVDQLKKSAEELGGVSEVVVHSWKTAFGSNIPGQSIVIRLRIRIIQPKQYSAGQMVIPLREGLFEIENVRSVDEHSWTRLTKTELPVGS